MKQIRKRVNKTRLKIGFLALFLLVGALIATTIHNIVNAATLADLNPDAWHMELIFFDSTVNGGREPLTEIDWQIADSTISETQMRVIKYQINYSNPDAQSSYAPGELEIRVPNLISGPESSHNGANLAYDIALSADSSATSGTSDWWYKYENDRSIIVFTNKTNIDEHTAVEGSIQVTYGVTSNKESREQYQDSCTHTLAKNLQAVMNGNVETNTISFNYSRVYNHPWDQTQYTINKTATKISSYDHLPDNAEDYTWVRYKVTASNNGYLSSDTSTSRSSMWMHTVAQGITVGLEYFSLIDNFPSDVVVYDQNGSLLEKDSDGNVSLGNSLCVRKQYTCEYVFYAGYPEDIYNEESNNYQFTNTAYLNGKYANENEARNVAQSSKDINLLNFKFTYGGGANYLAKRKGQTAAFYYQDLKSNSKCKTLWFNDFAVSYPGSTYTARIGDDILYYTTPDGSYARIPDENYYFKEIDLPSLVNTNGDTIQAGKYTYELYVRKEGETNYQLQKSGTNNTPHSFDSIVFSASDKIVAWYIDFKDLTEGLGTISVKTYVYIGLNNIEEAGTLYNFNYLRVLVNGEDINVGSIDNYDSLVTKDEIATYDYNTYGKYLHRSTAEANWEYHSIGRITKYVSALIDSKTKPVFSTEDEYFRGSYYIRAALRNSVSGEFNDLGLTLEQFGENDFKSEFVLYDLLPYGSEPDFTNDEVIASAGTYSSDKSYFDRFVDSEGKQYFSNYDAYKQYLREHTTVEVTKNWHGTGRYRIKVHIDFSERPFANYGYEYSCFSYVIKYKVSYDSYEENGDIYTHRVYTYMTAGTTNTDPEHSNRITDDSGVVDEEEADLNDNGTLDENVSYADLTIFLLSATSSKQDLQTSVKTGTSGTYETEPTEGGHGEDYTYKVRVRTGASRVTNVILYSNLEQSHEGNPHWEGSFTGVDTSFAEGRKDYYGNPISVKVYYSENADATSMSTDDSWQEYDPEMTDKTKVRSVAFKILDQDGNPAILAQSAYLYVLITMRAPEDENIAALAYNRSFSEWNAIDNLTGELIHNITGVESNIVTVALDATFDINVKTNWDDYEDYYGVRPDTVTYTLYKDDEPVETKEMNVADGEDEVVFENIPTLEQDHYTVRQENIDEYSVDTQRDVSTLDYTFNNSITRDEPTFDITITTDWDDYENAYGIRPDTVTYTLYKDDEPVETIEMNVAEGENEIAFENIPELEREHYTVKQDDINEYTTDFEYDEDSNTYSFVNKIERGEPTNETPKTFDNIKFVIFGGGILVSTTMLGAYIAGKRR